MIAINAPAPDFTATTTDGRELRLSELVGRPVVLYFFPKAFTPGCTRQAEQFRDIHPEIEASGAVLIGVSTDDHQTQCEFAGSVGAGFPMVGDPTGAIARSYDVIWPLIKFTQRVTFVIDAQGLIRGIFHHELRIGMHAKNVIQSLKALQPLAPQKA